MTWTRSKHVGVFVECMWQCTFWYCASLGVISRTVRYCTVQMRILMRLKTVTRFVQCLTGTINTSHRMLQGCSIRFFRTKITSEVITLLNAARWFHWSIILFQRPPGTIMHSSQAVKRLKIRLWSDLVSYILNHAPTLNSTFPFLCNRRPPTAAPAAQQMTVHQGKGQERRVDAWFHASAAQQMRTALFWVITQRVVVISYRRFGTIYRTHLQGVPDGTVRLSRNVGRKLPLLAA